MTDTTTPPARRPRATAAASSAQRSASEQTAATEEVAEADIEWTATLRRGKRYVAFGKHFLFDEDKDVTAEEKAYLEKNAVDLETDPDEFYEDGSNVVIERAKFAFRVKGTPKPEPASRSKRRVLAAE